MTFYNKSKLYTKNATYHNTTEENAALAFELIAKKINQTEELYEQKKFEAASKKATETIDFCAALSTIFVDDIQNQAVHARDQEAMTINWEIYFVELISTITSLFIDHNPEKKEKLIKSLHTMAQLWRSLDTQQPQALQAQHQGLENLNINA